MYKQTSTNGNNTNRIESFLGLLWTTDAIDIGNNTNRIERLVSELKEKKPVPRVTILIELKEAVFMVSPLLIYIYVTILIELKDTVG